MPRPRYEEARTTPTPAPPGPRLEDEHEDRSCEGGSRQTASSGHGAVGRSLDDLRPDVHVTARDRADCMVTSPRGTHSSGNSHRSVGDRGCSGASASRLSRCLGSLADRGCSGASASCLSRCLGSAGFGYRSRWRSKNDIRTEAATTARPSKIGPRTYGTAVSRGWNQGGTTPWSGVQHPAGAAHRPVKRLRPGYL
jgi:hypothetical protein